MKEHVFKGLLNEYRVPELSRTFQKNVYAALVARPPESYFPARPAVFWSWFLAGCVMAVLLLIVALLYSHFF